MTDNIYDLYINGFQSPKEVAELVDKLFNKNKRKRKPYPEALREDFCGTAANCRAWLDKGIRGGEDRALGVDIDKEVINYAERTFGTDELILAQNDAVHLEGKADVVLCLNSSLFYFHDRESLLDYLFRCRRRVDPGGLVLFEVYDGAAARETGSDVIHFEGGKAIWVQECFNNISGMSQCRIDIHPENGQPITNAFQYDFRLWTIPEILDALTETGFHNREVLPIGDDRDTKKPQRPTDFSDNRYETVYIACYG